MLNRGAIVLNAYSRGRPFVRRSTTIRFLPPGRSSLFDLQIPRSSLIITVLFRDAARFRCGGSCFDFIFFVDRKPIVHPKELHGKAFENRAR